MRRNANVVADVRRLLEAVEAVDMDDPPTGRRAAEIIDRLGYRLSDANHGVSFFIDWLQIVAERQSRRVA